MKSEPLLTVQVESRHGVVRVALAGELDMLTAPALLEQLRQVEGEGVTEIVLDLRDLSFLDATGLHAFMDARADSEANGQRLSLGGANGRTRRLFALSGTEFLLVDEEAISVIDASSERSSSPSAPSGRAPGKPD